MWFFYLAFLYHFFLLSSMIELRTPQDCGCKAHAALATSLTVFDCPQWQGTVKGFCEETEMKISG